MVEWDVTEVLSRFTYSLTDDASGRFAIDSRTGEITVADGSQLDYESNVSHNVTVEVTDAADNRYGEVMSIAVLNALESSNTAPTGLSSGIELNMDGGNDAYLVADDGSAILGGLDRLTLEIAFATNSTEVPSLLSYAADHSSGNDLKVQLDYPSNRLAFHLDGSAVFSGAIDFRDLLDGQKHSVAVSWESASGAWVFYVDGEYVDSGTGFGTGKTIDAGGTLLFGQEQDSNGGGFQEEEQFRGNLYDVRIWDEVRSEAEIALNYQHKVDPASLPAGLVANWQMDGFNGANEVVDVVSGNNLSIGHAAGFTSSTPVDDLNVDENSASGTSVGFVVPTELDGPNNIVGDGSFTAAGGGYQIFTAGQTIGGAEGSWLVTSGDVDVEGTWAPTPLGGNALGLDGTQPGAVSQQSLPTEAGKQYQVVFAMTGNFQSGNTVGDLNVSAGDASLDFHVDMPDGWNRTNNLLWEHRSFTFTANSSSTDLRFTSLSASGGLGPVIGDVQVLEIPPSIATILTNDPNVSYDAASGKFFKVVNSSTTWGNAQSLANANLLNGVSGRLATVRSGSEGAYVQQLLQIQGVTGAWIGASDAASEGEWTWQDGSGDVFLSGGLPVAGMYENFGALEPSGGTSENYAEFVAVDGSFNDLGVAESRAYVIEWDASNVLSNFTFDHLDDANGRFDIDSRSGEITVSDGSMLDHEANASHDVTVEVTDAAGNTYSEVLTITVNDVNEAPTVVMGSAVVVEGQYVTLTPAMLQATDVDADDGPGDLTYAASNLANGQLEISGVPGVPITSFTQAQIAAGQIVFLHDGSETTTAGFDFSLADGGEDGVSPATGTFNFTVTPSNDAPVLDSSGTMTLNSVAQDSSNNNGQTVASVIASAGGDRITDVDGDPEGIAIVFASNANGSWQYSLNNGSTWNGFPGLTAPTALMLDETARIRFEPNPGYSGTESIFFHAWDQTTGVSGGVGNVGTNGGTTAFSGNNEQASLNVVSGLSIMAPTTSVSDEDTGMVYSGANVIRVDDGVAVDSPIRVELSVVNGTLALANTTGVTLVEGTDGSGSMVIEGLESAINTALDGLRFTPNADYNGGDTLSITTALAADLTGHYTFEGGVANDQSAGTAHDGTLNGNATTVVDGTRDEVLSLDGTGDFVQIESTFGSPASATIGGWVNFTGSGRGEFISIDDRLHLKIDETGAGIGGSIQTLPGVWNDLDSNVFISGTGWHHVMYVFDDVNDVHTLYLDGVEIASESTTDSVDWAGATTTYIGQHPDGTDEFAGLIDDARIYTRALSTDEIAALATDQAEIADSVAITVNPVNDAPVADLDADNSGGPGLSFNTTFTEDGGPVLIGDTDAFLSDVDDTHLTGIQVTIINHLDGN